MICFLFFFFNNFSYLINFLFNFSKSLNCSDAAKQLAIASASMRYVNQRERKLLAQRAVHTNPTNKEAWSSLIACL